MQKFLEQLYELAVDLFTQTRIDRRCALSPQTLRRTGERTSVTESSHRSLSLTCPKAGADEAFGVKVSKSPPADLRRAFVRHIDPLNYCCSL